MLKSQFAVYVLSLCSVSACGSKSAPEGGHAPNSATSERRPEKGGERPHDADEAVSEKLDDPSAKRDDEASEVEDDSPAATLASTRPGPLSIEPSTSGEGELPHDPQKHVDDEDGTFMNHVTRFGWSTDGNTFAYCHDSAADMSIECVFVDERNQSERVVPESEEELAQLEKRLAVGGHVPGPREWAYGGEITLTWTHEPKTDKLRIGARTKDGGERNDVLEVPVSDEPADLHLELVSVSSDGKRIAVVAHAWSGESTDEYVFRSFGSDHLAAEVHSALGLRALRTKQHDEAAQRFERAAEVRPAVWKYPYNVACAHALAGKGEEARASLEKAIELGGDAVKRRARRDDDLASVRGEPWFSKLVD